MLFLIAGLLVLNLAVTLVGVQLLRREAVGLLLDEKKRLDMVNRALLGVNEAVEKLVRVFQERDGQRKTDMEALRKEIADNAAAGLVRGANTAESLSGLWKEAERQTAALRALLSREDASEAVRQLARQLEDSPALLGREEESALSKAVEEGISSILGFSVGKGREAPS